VKEKPIVRALLVAGLSAGLVAGCNGIDSSAFSWSRAATPAVQGQTRPVPSATSALPDFSALAAQYGPAVVNISVTEAVKTGGEDMPQIPNIDPSNPFWRFFRDLPWQRVPPNALMRGEGSGFIVSPDGVILTNAHVVDGAKEVTVKLTDRREFKAKVIGKDDQSDVAVLKISATNLPVVRLGDSSQVKVGQWVVAIGSPFGFENSVTAGIVSAKGRSLGGSYVPFLQTDVAVNPGNSGGPLFGLNGEVIGINSQIYSGNGGFEGLSFAIPIELAANVESQLLASGHVTRGRLGITVQDMSQGLADSFGLKSPSGALVSAVDPEGPAAKAGIETGDVILKMNGQDVVNSTDLPVRVAELKPGTHATLELSSGGTTKDVGVTIGKFENEAVAAATGTHGEHAQLGLVVRPLTSEERQQAGVEGGLMVSKAGGVAAEAGIEAGDIIVAVNNTPVKNAQQLRSLVDRAGKHVALLVRHGDASEFVAINIG